MLVGSIAAQTVKVNVKDSSGEPVIGASVLEKGTRNGGITDLDGNFSIKLTGKNPITVSYIGMKTKTVDVKGKTSVNVVLEDDNTTLNDVVVIGYGSVRKKDITGSVATVNSEALQAVPVANASEALTGKMPGVQITTTEGSPDADVKIRVRGGGSITQSNEPLYIVDGFPVESISDIPANDIEDITVLKDASSTAIYGSRGANGVILVTTKSGKAGQTKVSYNAYYSWKKIAKKMDVLNPADYAKWQYELALLKNANNPEKISSYTDYFGNYQDIDLYNNIESNDWQDLIYGRTGHTFNHNININGGTDNIKYAFSYAHMYDKAIMIGSDFKRDNLSLKLNTKPTRTTTLDFQVRYANTKVNGAGSNDATGTYDTDKRLKFAVIYYPMPLKNLDPGAGTEDDDLGNLYNPIVSQSDNDRQQIRKNLNMAGSFGWEIFKNFKIKTEFGYDDYSNYDKRYYGLTSYIVRNYADQEYADHPLITLANTTRERFRNTNTINYDFKQVFGKDSKHSLNLLAGHEWINTKQHVNTNQVVGFPKDYDSDKSWRLSAQGVASATSDVYSPEDKLLSFFARANYNFMDKYLVSATFRADASSKFAKSNRWGYFPSAAIAWRISAEPFMAGAEKWLDDMKIRLSYGTAGNNNIPSGQLIQEYEAYTATAAQRTWVNGFSNPLRPSTYMANPDLKWETTITRNAGIDFTMFSGKLNGSIEGYINTTKDLLIAFPVQGTGYESQYRNMGKTENKGLEISLTYHIINKKDWGIDVSGNIGFNKTKIKSLGEMQDFGWNTNWASTEIGNDYNIALGGAVGEVMGYKSAGRYEVSDFESYDAASDKWKLREGVADATALLKVRPGAMKLVDVDGNGTIGNEDIVKIGDVNPTAFGGFNISARAFGFDLAANFNYSIGNQVYNANRIEYTQTSKYQYRNMITEMADGERWTNLDPQTGLLTNDPTRLAELNTGTSMWSPYTNRMILTDWAIENADFLRLNTLSLGYTLPVKLTKRVGINSLRFYVTAYNVFTITKYTGFDPEADCIRRTSLTPSVDYSGYPKSRQFVIGLNLNF
jgi:TonB-linked SusC/RagA family outer membrane protein